MRACVRACVRVHVHVHVHVHVRVRMRILCESVPVFMCPRERVLIISHKFRFPCFCLNFI